MSNLAEISPAELVADVLNRLSLPNLASAIVVGPATDQQQQAGVISVMGAGLPQVERYVPVQWLRAQVRCLAPTLSDADEIAHRTNAALHGRNRTIARMASTDRRYLIHLMNVTAGPSMHYDSPETWETLIFAEIMIGVTPIS